MPTPGQTLELSDRTRQQLGHETNRWIDDLENDHAQFFADLEAQWSWYHAKPRVKRRTFPFDGASNIVVPVIRWNADSITSRIHNRLHTPRKTWTLSTPDDTIRRLTKPAEDFLNRASRRQFDIQSATRDWVGEMVTVGESVLAASWQERFAWRIVRGSRKPQRVLVSRGPVVEHVPREAILWLQDRLIKDSPIVVRQKLLTVGELIQMGQTDDWDVEAVLRDTGLGGPAAQVLESQRETEGVSPDAGSDNLHDVREVWLDWPSAQLLSSRNGVLPPELAEADEPFVPIVLWLHRKTGHVFKAIAHPYAIPDWPFFDIYFRRTPGRGRSQGVAKILEMVQRAITTVVNQTLDNNTLKNSLKLATTSPRLKDYKFNPFRPIYVEGSNIREELLPINVATAPVSDINIVNMLTAMGERVTGISDPHLGREVRMGGHPSPATSTLALLAESRQVFDMTLQEVRRKLSDVGQFVFSLYQQEGLGDDAMIRALGPLDGPEAARVLLSEDGFRFDIFALSETNNPDAQRTAALTLFQATQSYYASVIRLRAMANDPQQDPGVREAAGQAVQALTEAFTDFLEAQSVDNIEDFVLRLEENRGNAVELVRRALGAAGNGAGAGAPGAAPGPVPEQRVEGAAGGAGDAADLVAGLAGSGFDVG